MGRKKIKAEERERIYRKYGGRCAYCGQPIAYSQMQVEHKEPLYLGGADEPENYMPSCRMCNHYKHTLTTEKFKAELGMLPERLKDVYIFNLALRYGLVTINEGPITFLYEREEGENDGEG